MNKPSTSIDVSNSIAMDEADMNLAGDETMRSMDGRSNSGRGKKPTL